MPLNFIKHYPFSILIVICVVLLSVCPIGAPDMAKNVPLADKWTHMVMYACVAIVVWWEYSKNHRPHPSLLRLFLWGLFLPILLGGVLELVQNYGTSYRSGEWLDGLADSIGALAGCLVSLVVFRNKDR